MFKKKVKKTARDYVGKNISYAPFRGGMGIMRCDTCFAYVAEVCGDGVMVLRDVEHHIFGQIGHRRVLFNQIVILDSWDC